MSETILAVEYEPRYIERIRHALSALPFPVAVAKDGAEAVETLRTAAPPKLIVLSSVIPKMSTLDLIREIRGRDALKNVPILLTVSGYTGKSPAADAQRIGANELLAKPYAEPDLLQKVQMILGLTPASPAPPPEAHQYTSDEIFGDIVEDGPHAAAAAATQTRRAQTRSEGDVDKMLADTLADVMPGKKGAPAAAPRPADRPKTHAGSDIDKLVSDTLAGIERPVRRGTSPGVPLRTPAPAPAAAPQPASPRAAAPASAVQPVASAPVSVATPPPADAHAAETPMPDRVPVSQPILTPDKEEHDAATPAGNFGQYDLIEKIATGGMAEVWKAKMVGVEGFQKIVAIKKILPHLSDNRDFIEMFVDEAKVAAQLNHNNITHIYDLGKLQGSYYIAMEYIDGYDLKTILNRSHDRGDPMSVELALFVAAKIAAALDYAHRKRDFEDREMGIVHRDVSPQNVLISQEGDIKLCDFGIAKAASKASHTQAGALKGKLQYMSPEQAWGKPIDRRSDVFALATVLFELLTGRKLFSGDNEMSVLDQVREAIVRAPSELNDEVPPEVDSLVLKALAKDPADRYQSAGEMARDIDAILYTFKPTPTSADLAIYLDRLWAHAPAPAQNVVPTFGEPATPAFSDVMNATPPVIVGTPPAIVSAPIIADVPPPQRPAATSYEPTSPLSYEEPKKKPPVMLIGVAAVVVIALAGGGAFLMLGKKEPAPQAAAPVTASTTSAAIVPTATVPVVPTDTATTQAAPAVATALDPSLVDIEVQRRLAAERARLEQQARARTTTVAPETATARPAADEVVPQTATRAPEQPATQTVAPVVPTPAPAVTETRAPEPAAPAPQQPAQPQRAREGDLIPAGTPGLTPPRVLRQGTVTYPPIAKIQRVEGTVVVNVLVSENGSVLDTRIVRGVNRPVGLNEAAEQAMRRSSFAPAMKDGVKVRAWLSVPVEFKL